LKFRVLKVLYEHQKRGGKGMSYVEICGKLGDSIVDWHAPRTGKVSIFPDPLIEAGLVASCTKIVGKRIVDAYYLPKDTFRRMAQTFKQGWLDEGLRLGILDVKTLGLPFSAERRLKRFRIAADVLLAAKKGRGPTKICSTVPGAHLRLVEALLYQTRRPWTVIGLDALKKTYFPHLSPEQRSVILKDKANPSWIRTTRTAAKLASQS
jgi:hypothetical protein